jgi:hypothetical protein
MACPLPALEKGLFIKANDSHNHDTKLGLKTEFTPKLKTGGKRRKW